MSYWWKVWACALGPKVGDDAFADDVAIARSAIVVTYIATNVIIMAYDICHW